MMSHSREEFSRLLEESHFDIHSLKEILKEKKIEITDRTREGDTFIHVAFQRFGFPLPPLHKELIEAIVEKDEKEIEPVQLVNNEEKTCFDYLIQNEADPRKEEIEKRLKKLLEHIQKELQNEDNKKIKDELSLKALLNLYHLQYWCEVYQIVLNNPQRRNSMEQTFFDIFLVEKEEGWDNFIFLFNELLLTVCKIESIASSTLFSLGSCIRALEEKSVSTFPLFLEWYEASLVDNEDLFKKLLRTFIQNGSDPFFCDKTTGELEIFSFLKKMQGKREYWKIYLKECSDLKKKEMNWKNIVSQLKFLRNDDSIDCCIGPLIDAAAAQALSHQDWDLMREIWKNITSVERELFYRENKKAVWENTPDFILDIGYEALFPDRIKAKVKQFGQVFSLHGWIPLTIRSRDGSLRKMWLTHGEIKDVPLFLFFSALNTLRTRSKSTLSDRDFSNLEKVHSVLLSVLKYNNLELEYAIDSLWEDCHKRIAVVDAGDTRHCVYFVIVEGKTLYRCNKGAFRFGDIIIEEYRLGNPKGLTRDLLEKLLRRRTIENQVLMFKELHTLLDLTYVGEVQGNVQTSGNCELESLDAAIRAILWHLYRNTNASASLTVKPLEEKEGGAQSQRIGDRCRRVAEKMILDTLIQNYPGTPLLDFALRRLLCYHFDWDKEEEKEQGVLAVRELRKSKDFEWSKVEFLIQYWMFGFYNQKDEQEQLCQFLKYCGVDFLQEEAGEPIIVKMYRAIIQKNDKAIEEIIHCGIHPMSLEYLGWTPLHLAVGNDHLVDCFLAFAPGWVNCSNFLDRTPAFYLQSVSAALSLTGARADIHRYADDNKDLTPLNEAIKNKRLDVVKHLLAQGVKPSPEAMHCAAKMGCTVSGELLLRWDPACLDKLCYRTRTPLLWAVMEGQLEFVKFLLDKGANPNSQDVNGNTALHYAARYNQPAILDWLKQVPGITLDIPNHNKRLFSDYLEPGARDSFGRSAHSLPYAGHFSSSISCQPRDLEHKPIVVRNEKKQ